MQIANITRRFSYNGRELPDPGAALNAKQVLEVYTNTYPELMSAAIEGPVLEGGVETYTFVRAVRDKGCAESAKAQARRALRRLIAGRPVDALFVVDPAGLDHEQRQCGAALLGLAGKRDRTDVQAARVAGLPLQL